MLGRAAEINAADLVNVAEAMAGMRSLRQMMKTNLLRNR